MNENPQFIFDATYWDREKFFFPPIQDASDVKEYEMKKKNPLIARMWFILLCVAHFFFHIDLNFFLKKILWFIGALNRLCFIRQNRLNFYFHLHLHLLLHFGFTNVEFVDYWMDGEIETHLKCKISKKKCKSMFNGNFRFEFLHLLVMRKILLVYNWKI